MESLTVDSVSLTAGIVERREFGLSILSPAERRPFRRLIFLNSYGGAVVWRKIKEGLVPAHHLYGALELARMGYEVALAEPLEDFYLYQRPYPHDLQLLKIAREWLGRDGILFCGHNVLYWLPLLRGLGLLKCKVVSTLFAREPLKFGRFQSGVVGLTRAGAEQAGKLAPHAKVGHLGWGVHLDSYPILPYRPESFFSCGIALRDFLTLSHAAAKTRQRMEVVCPGEVRNVTWPPNAHVVDGGQGWNTEDKKIVFHDLLHTYYARSAGSLIIVKRDSREYIACGFTELIEAMAMGRPAIVTRTGALPTEIDVEKAGCGIFVPPEDPGAIAEAMEFLAQDPDRAEAMGLAGRQLCERHYNINRFAAELHNFFESL